MTAIPIVSFPGNNLDNQNNRPLLRDLRGQAGQRSLNRLRLSPPAFIPPPWPIDFDPPAFPCKPGRMSSELRALWYAWMEAWDDVAEGMELESAATLWGLYDQLIAEGVAFDPRFIQSFDAWRHNADVTDNVDREDFQEVCETDFPNPQVPLRSAGGL